MSEKRKRSKNNMSESRSCKAKDAAMVESHPCPSVYKTQPICFQELAAVDSNFREAWDKLKNRQKQHQRRRHKHESFSTHVDSEFTLALTRALLQRDFRLMLPSIPLGYLCPPLPNRLNYVCWLRKLLDTAMDCDDDSSKVVSSMYYQGIDLGTGATCIYPLLLSTFAFSSEHSDKWKFLATDIDPVSVESAQRNLEANHLQHRIRAVCVPQTAHNIIKTNDNKKEKEKEDVSVLHQGPILAAMNAANDCDMFRSATTEVQKNHTTSSTFFDFVMTNPPFYSSREEAQGPRAGDGRKRTDMTIHESVYKGGEFGFISDMIQDSLLLRSRITWYTSMIGKKSTQKEVEKKLRAIGFPRGNFRTTQFIQGNTTRWGIAWTFQEVPERLLALKMKPFQDFHCNIHQNETSSRTAEEDILNRISEFCQTQSRSLSCNRAVHRSDSRLGITIREEQSAIVPASKDATTTNAIQISQGSPFVIDIFVQQKSVPSSNDDTTSLCCVIQTRAYSNSTESDKFVHKLLDSMQSYVSQTSRFWRRKKNKINVQNEIIISSTVV